MRRCKLRYEAVQIEAGEAVQIEAQAWRTTCGPVPSSEQGLAPHGVEAVQIEEPTRVLGRVIRDPSNTRLPATAWPRQTLAVMYATQRPLPESGRGDYDPPFAGSNSGKDEGRLLVLMQGPSRNDGWWCRLGCRARSFLPRVHLNIRESGVRGRDPPAEEITETVISRDEWYLRVGLSLFG